MRKLLTLLILANAFNLVGCSIEGTRILNLSGHTIEFQFRLETDEEWSPVQTIEPGMDEMFGWGQLAENLLGLRIIEDDQSYRLSRDSVERVKSYCTTSWLRDRFDPHICYMRYYGRGKFVMRNLVVDRREGSIA